MFIKARETDGGTCYFNPKDVTAIASPVSNNRQLDPMKRRTDMPPNLLILTFRGGTTLAIADDEEMVEKILESQIPSPKPRFENPIPPLLLALVRKWLNKVEGFASASREANRDGNVELDAYRDGKAMAFKDCAYDLETLLASLGLK